MAMRFWLILTVLAAVGRYSKLRRISEELEIVIECGVAVL